MALGSWKAPLPLKLGGGGRAIVDTFYKQMQAARPDALSGKAGTQVDVENRAAARMLAAAWRATARRIAQADPTRLSSARRPVTFPDGTTESLSMLERWERILRLSPSPDATLQARRATVATRVAGLTSATLASITSSMVAAFGSWLLLIGTSTVAEVTYPGESPPGNVTAFWADGSFTFNAEYPGQYSGTFPWLSGLAHIVVVIAPPINVPQSEVDVRIGAARQVLDDVLPAWMTFEVSQLPPDQTEPGFFADISKVGQTAV